MTEKTQNSDNKSIFTSGNKDASSEPEKETEAAPEPEEAKADPDQPLAQPPAGDELEILKSRATVMGIPFSNNIKADTLRERINAKLTGEKEPEKPAPTPPAAEPEQDKTGSVNALTGENVEVEREMTQYEAMYAKYMKLVRLRITNLDPKKADLPGEIFTVANGILGTVRKYVPYGEVTDNGYHVPYWIYKRLEKRRFLHIKSYKDRRTGQQKVEYSDAKEFALEILPTLTQEELNRLSAQQQAAQGIM